MFTIYILWINILVWARNSLYDYSSSSWAQTYSIQVRLSTEARVRLFLVFCFVFSIWWWVSLSSAFTHAVSLLIHLKCTMTYILQYNVSVFLFSIPGPWAKSWMIAWAKILMFYSVSVLNAFNLWLWTLAEMPFWRKKKPQADRLVI